MNFLAHLYLAGKDEGLIIGNFIADSIRGKEINDYSVNIQKGIVLHRKIDEFTDGHPIVKKTVARLRKSAAKYAPVVSDVIYDHFLATNWLQYSPTPLPTFAQNSYQFLNHNKHLMPNKIHLLLEYMIRQNWLVKYASIHGIAQTLKGMQARVHFSNTMASSVIDLVDDYSLFLKDFQQFFPEIQEFVQKEKRQLYFE